MFWLSGASGGYTQDWLKGDETIEGAHPHEGLRLAGGDGWVAVGGTLSETTRKVIYMSKFLSLKDKIVAWKMLLGVFKRSEL